MEEMIQRIGLPIFIQIIIECWNGIFLLIMIFSVINDKLSGKNNSLPQKLPLANEIIIFYTAILLYNTFDILCCACSGDTSRFGIYTKQISEICYFAVGAFQTLFFLQLIKKYIAEKNGLDILKKITLAVQLLHIPPLVLLAATPITNALDYFDEQNYYHGGDLYFVWYYVTIISFAYVITVTISQRKKTTAFLFVVFAVSSIVPLVAFICNFTYSGISFNNISVSITALIIYIFYEKYKAVFSVSNAVELEKVKTQLAENRLALEKANNDVLMARIQPHFISNSLMAIRAQCIDNPEVYKS